MAKDKTKVRGLHKFIAVGNKPKDYKGASSNAVANKK
jgi:hypothetical protein